MVNCNPETVSTDYDTSDRLYFEPLTTEDVLEIVNVEQQKGKLLGLNVQFGGQTPLKLAESLEAADVPLLGTSNTIIQLAEDREKFKEFIEKLGLKQPKNDIVFNAEDLIARAKTIGMPVVVRPSFVLGGRSMRVVKNIFGLRRYLTDFPECFDGGPLLLDSFLKNAIEVDVDAICDGTDVYIAGVMEHIEEAGIHSGDSACSIPPYSLPKNIVEELKVQARKIALGLHVNGLINIQFAIADGEIYILEVNPRASRTVPFVAKATGIAVAKIASLVMIGFKLKDLMDIKATEETVTNLKHFAVKEVVFPFNKFSLSDIVLGPEMKSTGEAMGIDKTFSLAFAKAQLGCNNALPRKGNVFVSVKDEDKKMVLPLTKILSSLGFGIISTKGTAKFLRENGVTFSEINKVMEGSPHIVDAIIEGKVQLIINTTEGEKSLKDSFSIRRSAIMYKVPHTTTNTGAREIVGALRAMQEKENLEVMPIQSYNLVS
jgi:carbamoyl-phosphate synthase large subunit